MFPASSNDRPQREDERIQPPPIAGIDGPHTLNFFDRRRILPKFPVVKRNPNITSRLPHIAPRWVGEPTARNTGRSQPVGATPSDMNLFSKGGVYGTRKTGQAFDGAEDRHGAPLEGGRVVA